jgi:hypothetical protein
MKNFKVTKNGKEIANGLNHQQALLKLAQAANDYAMTTGYYKTTELLDIIEPDGNVTIFTFGEDTASIGGQYFEIETETKIEKIEVEKQTYDIYFQSNNSSMNKGFRFSLEQAKNYIDIHNGINHSYFQDFKGGMAQIVCNETEEVVYETEIF